MRGVVVLDIVSLRYTFTTFLTRFPLVLYLSHPLFVQSTRRERRAWSVYVEIGNEHVRSIELNENAVATTTKAANGRDKLSCT